MTTSRQGAGAKGRLGSLKPKPQMQTTGLPFCRAYALDTVCADIFVVQSVFSSDCMFSQSVTSYMM
ncbi:hypothetical protein [Micromonospora sp. NPDC005113]